MKIIHLISGGDSGGAKTHVFNLLDTLREKIHIQLVCLTDGPFLREAKALGIDTVLLQQSGRFDLSVLKTLIHKLKSENIDILHCHGARANFLGALVKKSIDIPLVTTMHSDYRQDFAHSLIKQLVFMPLNKFSLHRMDYYFSVTHVFGQMLVEQGFSREKIRVIYNGIKVDDYEGSAEVHKESSKLRFGCVTTLRPIKGTHYLLEAARLLKEEGVDFHISIAGGGSGKYVEELYAYVKKNNLVDFVTFKGYVKDMDAFYDSIDVNILPSSTESFPYALLEGGIRQKGTIASKAGGIVEMIEDGKSGLLFDVGDSHALAELMKKLINNQNLIQVYGKNFRQRIVAEFSAESMAKRHIELYKEIMHL